jgi:hypothetical protein
VRKKWINVDGICDDIEKELGLTSESQSSDRELTPKAGCHLTSTGDTLICKNCGFRKIIHPIYFAREPKQTSPPSIRCSKFEPKELKEVENGR